MHQRWKYSAFVMDILFIWLRPSCLVFFYLTGIAALLTRPAAKRWKSKNLSSPRLNRNDSASPSVVMPAPVRVSLQRVLQSWYVFTSSHISSTVIKTIMKLRKSSLAERSMVTPREWRRRGEERDRCPWPDKHAAIENYKSIYKANNARDQISNVILHRSLRLASAASVIADQRDQSTTRWDATSVPDSSVSQDKGQDNASTHGARSARLKVRD